MSLFCERKKLTWVSVKEFIDWKVLRFETPQYINYVRVFFQIQIRDDTPRWQFMPFVYFTFEALRRWRVKRSIDFGFKRHPLKPQTANEVRSLKIPCPRFPSSCASTCRETHDEIFIPRSPACRVSDDFGKSWVEVTRAFAGWFRLAESLNRKVR